MRTAMILAMLIFSATVATMQEPPRPQRAEAVPAETLTIRVMIAQDPARRTATLEFVPGAAVIVSDGNNRVVAAGQTDSRGYFRFAKPKKKFTIRIGGVGLPFYNMEISEQFAKELGDVLGVNVPRR